MGKKKRNIKLRLNIVFFLLALGIFTLTLLTLFLLDLHIANKYTIDALKEKNVLELKNYSNEIKSDLDKNMLIVSNLRTFLADYKKINEPERRKYYRNFLGNVISVNQEISSIFTVWKPYTLDSYDYKYKNLFQGYTGQYALWLDKANVSDTIAVNSEEIALLSTYEGLFQEYSSDIIVISPVLHTQIGGANYETIRIVGAIRNKQMNLLGIIGIDIPINNVIKSLPLELLQNIILVNDNFKIIYSTQDHYIGRDIKTFSEDILNSQIFSYLLRGKFYFGKTSRSLSSSKFYIAYPIRYSDRFWTLIKFIPLDEYKAIKKHYTKLITISSFAIFLLFAILLTGFFIVYSKMIKFQERLLDDLYLDNKISKEKLYSFKIAYKEYEGFTERVLKIQEKTEERIKFIKAINEGNYDIPDLVPVSDNDIIAHVLNELKTNLKKTKEIQEEYIKQQEIENWRNTGLAKFNEILRTYINDPETLAYETISNLTDYLDAQVGAFFTLVEKDGKEVLELSGYYGYNRKIYEKKYFEIGDGLTGNVALEKKPTVTRVPDDYIELATGLGKAKPNYIAVYPLMSHEILYGVIEIAKIEKFEDHHLQFLEELSQIIASSLATVRINQETKKLLEKSQAVTKQMQEKEEELEKTIQQLEKVQKESQEQQVKLEAIISALNQIVYYIEFTKGKKVITVNKQIEENFNITYTEATEKNFFELFNIPVTKIDDYKKHWENVLSGHKTEFNLEIELEDKTIWIKATLIPIIKGLEVDRILFIGIDITPMMERETQLEKLLLETKEKEERIKVQEMEMELTLEELENLRKTLEEKEVYVKKLEQELQELKNKHQGLMKEFQKRLSHSRKLETALREKITKLQQQVEDLKQKLKEKGEDTD